MTIIALDPGQTTGVAIHSTAVPGLAEIKEDELGYTHVPVQEDRYILAAIRNPTDLWDIIEYHNPAVVIFENFQSAGLISKDGQATLRLIGAIEVVCYKLGIPCLMQTPMERMAMMQASRAMLKQLNRPLVSHEVDALAHLLLYEQRVEQGVADQIYARRRHTSESTR